MRYATVCSGIEAPSLAWRDLGWRAAWFSEISTFPCAVLAHHYPDVPNLGDMTQLGDKLGGDLATVDLLFGGTPCQSFSVAGLRGGMADARGGLALEFTRLAERIRPRWVVWENVPGVLSTDGGRAFGSLLGALAALGYGWAYRVLDAQYWGVAQRRRRVFVVAHLGGSWQRAGAVLFDTESLRGGPAPSREAGAIVANTLTASLGKGGPCSDDAAANHLIPSLANCLTAREGRGPDSDATTTLLAFRHWASASDQGAPQSDVCPSLRSADACGPSVAGTWGVRRLMPVECERLQGMPDGYTLVPYRGRHAKDAPRYQAIGNSIAIPPLRWIGERIGMVEGLSRKECDA